MSVTAVAVAGVLFVMERSATRWAVVVAVAKLLAGLVSSVRLVAVTVAVLTDRKSVVEGKSAEMVKGWVALGASVQKVQVTGAAVLEHPALAETKLTCTGSTSATMPPLEVEGLLLVSVRV